MQVAGGVVVPNPDTQLMPPDDIAGFRLGDRPPGLLLVWPDAKTGRLTPKDVRWAQESGYVGWPLYSKEWLIKSVLGYKPLWGEPCGIVPSV